MQDYLHSLLTFRRATYIACIPRTSCSITNTNQKYKHKYKYIYKYNDRGSGIECAHKSQPAPGLGKCGNRRGKVKWDEKLSAEFLQFNFPFPASLATAGWLDQKQETQEVSSADS